MRGIHILKYTLRAQETYDKAVAHNPCMLRHFLYNLKTQEMYDTAVRMDPGMIVVLDGDYFIFLQSCFFFFLIILRHRECVKKPLKKKPMSIGGCP